MKMAWFKKLREKRRLKREAKERARQEQLRKEAEEKERIESQKTKENDDRIKKMDKSVLSLFLQNPFRILGLSCKATKADALEVKDKLEKLERLHATKSYKSEFDLKHISLPSRELSALQACITQLEDVKYRWFWFETSKYCKTWGAEYNLVELKAKAMDSKAVSANDYDLFLACYLRALLYGDMEELDTVMYYMNEKLFSMSDSALAKFLRKRLPAEVSCGDKEIIDSFKEAVLSPISRIFEAGDEKRMSDFLDENCMADKEKLQFFTESLCTSMAHWVDGVFEDLQKYLEAVNSENPTEEQKNQVASRMAKIEEQLPLVGECIDYASD